MYWNARSAYLEKFRTGKDRVGELGAGFLNYPANSRTAHNFMPNKKRANWHEKNCQCCNGSGRESDLVRHGRAMSGYRMRAGIGLRAMAKLCGVSHTYLWQMEKGSRPWPNKVESKYKFNCLKQTNKKS